VIRAGYVGLIINNIGKIEDKEKRSRSVVEFRRLDFNPQDGVQFQVQPQVFTSPSSGEQSRRVPHMATPLNQRLNRQGS
jgi:hypothetical protein